MKNKLMDLNNHLFAQLERLSDENVTGEKLREEIDRAFSIRGIAGSIIDNAKLALDAHKAINDGLIKSAPAMLGMEPQKESDKDK